MTLDRIKKILLILIGNATYTAGVVYFVLPTGLIVGGTTGLSLVVNHYFQIPLDVFAAIFNVAMFLIGGFILGKAFAMTTLLSSIAFPVFLNLLQKLAAVTGYPTDDEMLCTVFAGLLIGFGIALVIQQGASTGGMDIPPLVTHKWTGIPVAVLLYVFDFLILIMQMVFTESEKIMYGILLVCIYTVMLNKVLVTGQSKVQLMIFSKEYETISQRELFPVNEAVKKIDPKAFVVVDQVKEVRGYGFTIRKY